MLLDEPVAGLNINETLEVARLISEIRAQGTSVLLVEHDMNLVMGISDNVVVLNYGQKIADGRTEDEGIAYALDKGALVVITTRTGSGRIAARPPPPVGTPPGRRSRTIAGEDLAPVKARILLMLALTRTSDPAEVQRMFTEY